MVLWFLGACLAFGWFLVWLIGLELRLLILAAALALSLVGFLVAGLGWTGDRIFRPSHPRADWPREVARASRIPGAWALHRLDLMMTPRAMRQSLVGKSSLVR